MTAGRLAHELTSTFEAHRRRLFGLAYRLLGSAADAEEVVQDAYLRWRLPRDEGIHEPGAWLTRVTTNLALNRLTAARVRREEYIGPWLPEPILTDPSDPASLIERAEMISYALLIAMERLSPAERAVFVLREAFGYSHREIGDIVERSEADCRQLLHRARRRVAQPGAPARADPDAWRSLVDRFLRAAHHGDIRELEVLLADDVRAVSDGGGHAPVARRAVLGGRRVARLVRGMFDKWARQGQTSVAEINASPGVLGWMEGHLVGCFIPGPSDRGVTSIHVIANPRKLRILERQIAHLSQSRALSGS